MDMYRSQVRDGVITALQQRVEARNYLRYLPKLTLKKVRGFVDQPVSFDFPVTAVIGPNGGGKTTVLGAAACAYKDVSPRRFFAKSGTYDESMQDWSIEYELVDKQLNARDIVRRTASFKNRRWNREAPGRNVLIFGVSRTVPANERAELAKCSSGSFRVPQGNVFGFSQAVSTAVSRILGKDVTGYREMRIGEDGGIQLLTGVTPTGSGYSEFHFGAGESSIIRMIRDIEAAEDQSLILIEEIENGLHPVATISLVEYLIEAAERKRLQVIFTTHSNEALLPLPTKAIWVATRDKLFQGKLDVLSLRAITGQIKKQLVIFVEDVLAKAWVESAIRESALELFDHVEVHAMEGDGTAVATNLYHNRNPANEVPSICFIDGDSRQREDDQTRVFRLPGEMPESYIFDRVIGAWDRFGGKLTVALLLKFEQAERVKKICQDVRLANIDPHLLFSQIGEKLGFLPEETVRMAFCTIWCQAYPDEAKRITDRIPPIEQHARVAE